jgi:hypothetical protein
MITIRRAALGALLCFSAVTLSACAMEVPEEFDEPEVLGESQEASSSCDVGCTSQYAEWTYHGCGSCSPPALQKRSRWVLTHCTSLLSDGYCFKRTYSSMENECVNYC